MVFFEPSSTLPRLLCLEGPGQLILFEDDDPDGPVPVNAQHRIERSDSLSFVGRRRALCPVPCGPVALLPCCPVQELGVSELDDDDDDDNDNSDDDDDDDDVYSQTRKGGATVWQRLVLQ